MQQGILFLALALSLSLSRSLSLWHTHTLTHTHGSSLKCSGLIYPIEQSFKVDYLIRDELLSWLQSIVLPCLRISPLIHRILPNLTFLSLFPHPIAVEFSRLNFFPCTLSFSALPYICSSSPIFLFPFFHPEVSSFRLSFPPFLSHYKAANDYQMVVIQHFKRSRNDDLRLLVLSLPLVCVCVWLKGFFSCVPADTLQVAVLFLLLSSPSSPRSHFLSLNLSVFDERYLAGCIIHVLPALMPLALIRLSETQRTGNTHKDNPHAHTHAHLCIKYTISN